MPRIDRLNPHAKRIAVLAVAGVASLLAPLSAESAPAASPQQCQAAALARPAVLTGAYVGGYVLNNNHYEIRVSEPVMPSGCKGTVTLKPFQQKQELGDGLSPKLEWIPYGFRPDSTVIAHGQERVVMRAARLCWSFSIGGGGDGDLKRHTEARPAVRKTWRPQGGRPVSVIFSGTARTVCK